MTARNVDGTVRWRCGGVLAQYWTIVGSSFVEVAVRLRIFLTRMSIARGTKTPALWARTCVAAQLGGAAVHGSLLVEGDASHSTFSVALGMGHHSGRCCDLMVMNVGGGPALGEMLS